MLCSMQGDVLVLANVVEIRQQHLRVPLDQVMTEEGSLRRSMSDNHDYSAFIASGLH